MKNRSGWKRWSRRLGILVLFALLVMALLWFQGILLRKETPTTPIPQAPRLEKGAATARVERRVLPVVLVQPGFVEAIEPTTIAPRVMASILSIAGREGEAVEAGATLVRLDDRDARARLAQAEAGLAGVQVRADEAQLAFERAQRLLDAGALTMQEWEGASAARDGAQSGVAGAHKAVEEAEAALSWFQLAAPFAGTILTRRADPGQLAMPGQPILELYRADALRFRVAVPEERAAALAPGDEFELDFDRLEPQRARLTRILPSADPATGTVTLQLALAPHPELRPGLLGRLRLAVGERQALLVPAVAVERIGQVERVQLVREGRLTPVTVRTGKTHAELVEVLSGLAEGEEVRLP